jgi:hypothetical protein
LLLSSTSSQFSQEDEEEEAFVSSAPPPPPPLSLLLLLLLVLVLLLLFVLPNDSLHRILITFGELIGSSSSVVRLFRGRPPGGDIFCEAKWSNFNAVVSTAASKVDAKELTAPTKPVYDFVKTLSTASSID